MLLLKQIRKFSHLHITLLAVIPFTILLLGFNIYYISQGLIWIQSGYSDYYYGYYIKANGDGSLLMDILMTVFLIIIPVSIGIAIKTGKSNFLLLAAVLLLTTMAISQAYLGCIGSIIICMVGFFQMRKIHHRNEFETNGEYIWSLMLIIYISDSIVAAASLIIGWLGTWVINNPIGVIGAGQTEIPDWMTQGASGISADMGLLFLTGSVLPLFFLLVAAILMLYAVKSQGQRWCKASAVVFVLFAFFVTTPIGQMQFVGHAFFLPESLLSLLIIFFQKSIGGKTVDTRVAH